MVTMRWKVPFDASTLLDFYSRKGITRSQSFSAMSSSFRPIYLLKRQRERERENRTMTTVMLTPRSHLSLLRLFSRPRVPLFRQGLSLHYTRVRRHIVVRACASPTRTTYPSVPPPPISLPARATLGLTFSLALSRR
ncbi:hypothetical protein PUN28_002538 [Cardiocondyla obscurior]|uniref:Uncharacterized protein n=1 Tax=Cardiocondyla obscurior TaxID=286306 RepID=A0AAW2GUW4_9HYME